MNFSSLIWFKLFFKNFWPRLKDNSVLFRKGGLYNNNIQVTKLIQAEIALVISKNEGKINVKKLLVMPTNKSAMVILVHFLIFLE